MEKLRSIFSPGKDQDDQVMYGTGEGTSDDTANLGKLGGQGSHFNGHQTSDVAGDTSSAPSSTTAPQSSTGQTSLPDRTYQTENTTTPTTTTNPESGRDTTEGGPHPAANIAANKAFQSKQGTTEQEQLPGSFPAEQENPYKTSNLDPRVDSQSQASTSHPTPSQPATRQEGAGPRQTGNYGGDAGALPTHEKSHEGRDAGLAAGAAGGAALAAREHEKHKEKEEPTTQTTRDQPTSTGTTRDQSTTHPSSSNTTTGEEKPSLKSRAAAAVGIGGAAKEREAQKTGGQESTPDNTKEDYHNTWKGAPGDSGEREHGKDPSSAVRPAHGSAKAPSFLNNLTGQDTTGLDDSANKTAHEGHDRHHGTEAAAAGVGAAGIAEHEAKKHDQSRTTDPGYNSNAGVTTTGGTHPSVANEAARNNRGPTGANQETTRPDDHHYGRDAALAGTGVAGGAAYEAEKHHHPTQQTGTSTGDHFNNQRYDSSTSGAPIQDKSSSTQPHDHHYGRDTALAGGAGAAAYEADKHRHPEQQTGTTTGNHADRQRYNPDTSTTAVQGQSSSTQPQDHHYGRDAALVGGAGAAYEAERHHHAQQDTTQPRQPTQPNQPTQPTAPTQPKEPQTYYGAATTTRDPTQVQAHQDPEKEHHLGRDVAAGTAVAGGAGAIGYEEAERERKAREKELAKEQKAHEKEIAKEQKAHEKELIKEQKKEQKEHEKAVAKEHKAYEKEVAKEQKAHEKELAKEQKAHEKAIAEEEKRQGVTEEEEKDKKPGLVDRLLHRHKKDDGLEGAEEDNKDHHRAAEGAAAAGVTGAGAYEYEKHHDRQQPHQSELAREQGTNDKYAANDPKHGHRATEGAAATGVAGAGAYEYEKHHNRQEPYGQPIAQEQRRDYRPAEGAAATGAAGTGAYEYEKHHHQPEHRDQAVAQEQRHDYRPAEGAAATGVAGTGAYEYEKHHNRQQPYDQSGAPQERHDHRPAEAAAATGATGAGAYEYEKHHDKREPHEKHHDTYDEEKEKKPGLIDRLLHRHKKDDGSEQEEEGLENRDRDVAEGAAATGVTGAGAHEYDQHRSQAVDPAETGDASGKHERNRLHKDPPQSVLDNMYAEKPTTGYASQVTGGTGTTALAQGGSGAHGSHLTGIGNALDPAVGDRPSGNVE